MLLRDTPDNDPPPDENVNIWLANIVERAKARDQEAQEAFTRLFRLYNHKICTYLTRLVRSESMVEDLAQETFTKAWKNLPTLNNTACFKAWIYKIATNEANEYLRHWRMTQPLPSREEELSASDGLIVEGPEKRLAETDQIQWILAQLSPRERACLVLQQERFSQREIAEILRITEKNVSVINFRAKEKFRALLRSVKGESA